MYALLNTAQGPSINGSDSRRPIVARNGLVTGIPIDDIVKNKWLARSDWIIAIGVPEREESSYHVSLTCALPLINLRLHGGKQRCGKRRAVGNCSGATIEDQESPVIEISWQ